MLRSALLMLSLALLWAPARAEMIEETAYFLEEERLLLDFDINDPENTLSLLGDLDGTSMIIKVKGPAGNTLGVFKPTSGHTSHIAEVVAYRLCRRLKLPVCVPAIRKTLTWSTLQGFIEMLEENSFKAPSGSPHAGHYEAKEGFRKAMIDRLRNAKTLQGAFKSWVSPLVLYEDLGRIESVRRHPIYPYLKANGPPVGAQVFELRQCTRIYTPNGCYSAKISYFNLAEQFSGMLIVDALIGDNDRFAGGNVHLFSLEGRYIESGKDHYLLPSASLLMLDNGAGFMRDPGRALKVLRKDIGVTRFSRAQFDALSRLWQDYLDDPSRLMLELGLQESYEHGGRTFYPNKIFRSNLRGLVRYMSSLEKKYGREAWH